MRRKSGRRKSGRRKRNRRRVLKKIYRAAVQNLPYIYIYTCRSSDRPSVRRPIWSREGPL